MLKLSHLDAGTNFLVSTGLSCTRGTAKGGAQLKISLCAKNSSGTNGLDIRQARVERRFEQ